jgi:hypothetical protein
MPGEGAALRFVPALAVFDLLFERDVDGPASLASSGTF